MFYFTLLYLTDSVHGFPLVWSQLFFFIVIVIRPISLICLSDIFNLDRLKIWNTSFIVPLKAAVWHNSIDLVPL